MNSSEISRLFAQAELLRQKSSYNDALRTFRAALKKSIAARDIHASVACLLSIGDVCRMTGDFVNAEKAYVKAVTEAGKIADAEAAADAHAGWGLSRRGRGDWRLGIVLLRKALQFYRKKRDREGTAFTLWSIAGALRIKGDIPLALQMYRDAFKVFQSFHSHAGEGYCLCGLGGTSRIAGRFRDSLAYYQSANTLFRKLNDTFGTAYSYCGIGNAYRMTGEYRKALVSFSKASRLYRKIGDRVSYAYTLWSIGTTHKMLLDLLSARSYFTAAEELFKKTKDPRGLIYCQLAYGEIAMLKGHGRKAEKYFRDSLEQAKRYGFRVEQCHATMLISYLAGKKKPLCYNSLGVRLKFTEAPFNIP